MSLVDSIDLNRPVPDAFEPANISPTTGHKVYSPQLQLL